MNFVVIQAPEEVKEAVILSWLLLPSTMQVKFEHGIGGKQPFPVCLHTEISSSHMNG